MNFKDYIKTILSSSAADWNRFECWGSGSGPSYRNRFVATTHHTPGPTPRYELNVESHSSVAALRSNLSITIAWGLTVNDHFREPWLSSFADQDAASSWVDCFYNGGLVFREAYVTVDGGRAHLPLPEDRNGTLVVPAEYADLCRLVDSLHPRTSEFDHYLQRAQIQIIQEPWLV